MTQVSKHPLSRTVYERIFEILFESILQIKNRKESEEFFADLLTPTEKIMLAKRISVALLLAKDYDYRAIRRILHVSPPTIAAVSASMKYTGRGYQQVVEKLLKEEKVKEILLSVVGKIASIGAVGGKGSGDWWQLKRSIDKKKSGKVF